MSKTVTSSLELASKNIVCGSVKMVYALIYTLFLGFGLQIGSDLYFLFDPTARHHLATLATRIRLKYWKCWSYTHVQKPTTYVREGFLLGKYMLNGCYSYSHPTETR